jgi:DNA-directed RNA polymerase alpha subunit
MKSEAKANSIEDMKFEISEKARLAIERGIKRGDCVVEMEAMTPPLAQRTVNALELSEYKIVTLEQLVNCKAFHLMTIPNIGATALNELRHCLRNYDKLEAILENELIV